MTTFSDKINGLFKRGEWEKARRVLEKERASDPGNHWLLTQIGVTYYEQKKYAAALKMFLASRAIVDDCPLTLWNLAGTLDALGRHTAAIRIFTWLLASTRSPHDDPCWESDAWTHSLKADCTYRLGICFEHLGRKKRAEQLYRQYVELLLSGIDGSYSLDDAMGRIRGLHSLNGNGPTNSIRKLLGATLKSSGINASKARRKLPNFLPRR